MIFLNFGDVCIIHWKVDQKIVVEEIKGNVSVLVMPHS